MPATAEPATTLDEVVALYERFGRDHYDEDISQLDHALQTAALARHAGASDALVAAALLHDVGHLLDLQDGGAHPVPEDEDLRHESTGARYLGALFGPEVTAPIALHVRAKRYRCAIDPAYQATLSDGSRMSLVRQGGPMDETEAATFAANAGADDAVLLREWDDAGKVEDLVVAPFDDYLALLRGLMRTRH